MTRARSQPVELYRDSSGTLRAWVVAETPDEVTIEWWAYASRRQRRNRVTLSRRYWGSPACGWRREPLGEKLTP